MSLEQQRDDRVFEALRVLFDEGVMNFEDLKILLYNKDYTKSNIEHVLNKLDSIRKATKPNLIKLDEIVLNPVAAIKKYESFHTRAV